MKRPSFQFYPADWKNNSKLRRCSEAARGAWVDVLCLLHDSDEYGVCRWPLDELARAAGVSLKLVKELVAKDVLKGADKNAAPYIFTPRHAGKNGEPVTLVTASDKPCWYCSRFVRDEWIRQRRGQSTQFSTENQPPKNTPNIPPIPPFGEREGDGPTSPSPTTLKQEESSSSVKHHVDDDNSERPGLPPLQAVELDHTPAVAMTVELRKVGVNVTSIHPMLLEWITKGIHLKTLMEAVTLAREYKPAPERIPPAYLNTILAQMLNPKPSKGAPLPEARQWWETATGIEDKGITLGVLKNASEGFPDYKLRVFQAAGDGPWIEKSRGSSSTQGFTKASSSLTT